MTREAAVAVIGRLLPRELRSFARAAVSPPRCPSNLEAIVPSSAEIVIKLVKEAAVEAAHRAAAGDATNNSSGPELPRPGPVVV